MSLPKESTWHLFKGTWFVYDNKETTIHIQLKNSGHQCVYVNGTLASEKKSLKLRTEQAFEFKGVSYTVRTTPENVAMTSFSTELIIDNVLAKVFTFRYRLELKRYLPFLSTIVLLTIPLTLWNAPTWSFYLMLLTVLAIQVLLFNRQMFHIEEKDNDIQTEI
ncbi:hypothetical protein [Parvicella tangerina]|nr:hypothetical protein [Parvicella tangerina]